MYRTLIALSLGASALAACAPYEARPLSARQMRDFDEALAGRVAGPRQSCLPSFRASNFVAIRNGTLLFRDGGTTYATETGGGCDRLADTGYTLVTENFGGSLCRNSLAKVVDLRTGALVGTCVIGDFTPFRRPR